MTILDSFGVFVPFEHGGYSAGADIRATPRLCLLAVERVLLTRRSSVDSIC